MVRHREGVRHRDGLLRDRRPARSRRQVAGARQDPRAHGRGNDSSHPEGPTRSRAKSGARDAGPGHRGGQGREPLPSRGAGDPRSPPRRQDRVPHLRQGKVPRQGVHHAREARGGGCTGAGGLQQLHTPWSDREHRAERPDPERARGGPTPRMVRGALERGQGGDRRGHRDRGAAHAPLLAVRRLCEGPAGVLPRSRADRDRVGRDALADVPSPRSLPAGGLLGAHEDRPPTRRCAPVRRGGSREDLRGPDADRAADPARGQAGGPLRAQGHQGGCLGSSAPAPVATPHRRRGRWCGLQQPGGVQPHGPGPQGRFPRAVPADRGAR